MEQAEEAVTFYDLLLDLLLIGVAIRGIRETRGRIFAESGFTLYALRGFLGVIKYFTDSFDGILQFSENCIKFLCFPLFAADVVSFGVKTPLSVLAQSHLAVPLTELIGWEIQPTVKKASLGYTVDTLIYCDVKRVTEESKGWTKKELRICNGITVGQIQSPMEGERRTQLEIIADISLIVAACGGLISTRGKAFAETAFMEYAFLGGAGILRRVLSSNDVVREIFGYFEETTEKLVFPLFVAQVVSEHVEPWTFAMTHLLVPFAELFQLNVDPGLASASLGYSIGSILYADILQNRIYYMFLVAPTVFQAMVKTNRSHGFLHVLSCLLSWSIFSKQFPISFSFGNSK